MADRRCVCCERTEAQVPLLALRYQGKEMWICPQDMPVLIHRPEELVGRLPGAENLSGFGHE